MSALDGIPILAVTVNLPGPLALARLRDLGASIVKVEPPDGDPLERARPHWYRALHRGQTIVRADLRQNGEREQLEPLLADADLFLTSVRPATLRRLGLAWDELHRRYPRLSQVHIVGYPAPRENRPGHDLSYQAEVGLLEPPALPRVLVADFAGAEEAVSAALELLLARERGQGAGYRQVSLSEAARRFAEPFQQGLTAAGGELGGGLAGYNLYECRDGWLAVTALEARFWHRLTLELGAADGTHKTLKQIFEQRSVAEWEAWGAHHDIPLAAVRGLTTQQSRKQLMNDGIPNDQRNPNQ